MERPTGQGQREASGQQGTGVLQPTSREELNLGSPVEELGSISSPSGAFAEDPGPTDLNVFLWDTLSQEPQRRCTWILDPQKLLGSECFLCEAAGSGCQLYAALGN